MPGELPCPGDEDAASRWKRLISYLDIAWNVFNYTAMLVPGLGEAVLGLMVAQMLAELAEGIDDWSQGDRAEASAHINGVLINFAQLALMGAGHVLPKGLPTVKPSSFVDNLLIVEMPDGKTRLWKPDLAPYEHEVKLPAGSRPDRRGVYRHNEAQVLKLNDKHYSLDADPQSGKLRMEHPRRLDAYQPQLEHNGAGAWKTELERPLEWDKRKLLRRLGHSVDDFDDATLDQIQAVSGVDEDALRRMHVESEPPPPLLVDTITRFRAYADAGKVPDQLLDNQLPDVLFNPLMKLFTDPRHGWPESRAVELFDGSQTIKYGNNDALPADTLKLTHAEFRSRKVARVHRADIQGA
jgi:hypothetical protein